MSVASDRLSVIANGGVTSARGFRAAAVAAGIKPSGRTDLGVLVSDVPCVVAATFTQNAFAAGPVVVSRERVKQGRAQAVVFNAGNANACNGDEGIEDARTMAVLAADVLGLDPQLVLVASTGVIGQRLPMDKVRAGLAQLQPTAEGGHTAALGIMTTDTVPKEAAVSFEIGGRDVRIGAMTKGVGMIHPNMATMLAFIATDAALDPAFARAALTSAVNASFNMITVDGDTSTNDSCFLLANGLSGGASIQAGTPEATLFGEALQDICITLARKMARDGEGATKLIQVDVTGATDDANARVAARAVALSSLVKTAVYGEDPNWGRVFAAIGNSSATVDPLKAALWIGSVQVAANGLGTAFDHDAAHAQMTGDEVTLHVDLGLGQGSARAWGCDLTEKYVVENSAYTT